ncbi:MAG: TolB family protein [Bacillota bacterium]
MKKWLRASAVFGALVLCAAVAAARNDWKVIETAHFLVHFRPPDQKTADDVAFVAEEVHKRIEKIFNSQIREKISIIVVGEATIANGYAGKTLHTGIVVFPTFPGWTTVKANSWMEYLIIHEYAHALHMNVSGGEIAVMRKICGEAPLYSTPAYIENMAWIEGLAVYVETRFTPGGRGRDAEYRMLVRLAQMDHSIGNWNDLKNEDPYLWGYQMSNFIVEKFGEDKLMEIHKLVGTLTVESAEEAASKTLGMKWEEIERKFLVWVQAGAVRDILNIKKNGLTSYHRIIRGGILPSYNKKGNKLYFYSKGGVYTSDMQGENYRQIGSFHYQYSVSPNADKVAAVEGGSECGNLAVTYLGTGKTVYIVGPKDLAEDGISTKSEENRLFASDPCWSPDGRKIAFVLRHGLNSDLVCYDMEKRTRTYLVKGGFLDNFFRPAWSPDSGTVVYSVWKYGGFHDLQMIRIDAPESGPVDITKGRSAEFSPHWSPDGKYILFCSDLSGVINLFAFEPASGKFYQVSRVLQGAYDPVVSPGLDEIAFMSYSKEYMGIAVMPYLPQTWREVSFPGEEPPRAQEPPPYPSGWYNPLASLGPRFWIPANDYDRGGMTLGLAFAGMDNLQSMLYIGKITGGLKTGDPSYEFLLMTTQFSYYTYKKDFEISGGWENVQEQILNLGGMYARRRVSKDWGASGETERHYWGYGTYLDSKNYFAWEWDDEEAGSGFRFGLDIAFPGEGGDSLLPLPSKSQIEMSFNFLGNTMGDQYSLGGISGEFPLHFMPAGAYQGRKLLRYYYGMEMPLLKLYNQPFLSRLAVLCYAEGGKAWNDSDMNFQNGYGVALRLKSFYNQPRVEWGYAQDMDERWSKHYLQVSLSF